MKPVTVFIISVVIAVVGFFAGMKYQQYKSPSFARFQGGRFQTGTNGNNGIFRQGMRPVGGEIIKQDDKSVTVKMMDGSSKLVILSGTTKYHKNAETTKSELKTGTQISVIGTANSDGSVTAQDVLIGFGFRMGGGSR